MRVPLFRSVVVQDCKGVEVLVSQQELPGTCYAGLGRVSYTTSKAAAADLLPVPQAEQAESACGCALFRIWDTVFILFHINAPATSSRRTE